MPAGQKEPEKGEIMTLKVWIVTDRLGQVYGALLQMLPPTIEMSIRL